MRLKIPVTYAEAPKLSADAIGGLACARLEWEGLTCGERQLLRNSTPGHSISSGRQTWRQRLRERGITTGDGLLTNWGRLVREAGTRTTVEVDDAA